MWVQVVSNGRVFKCQQKKREAGTQGKIMTRLNERQYKLKNLFWSKSLKNTCHGVYFHLRSRSLAYKLLTKGNNSQLIFEAFD